MIFIWQLITFVVVNLVVIFAGFLILSNIVFKRIELKFKNLKEELDEREERMLARFEVFRRQVKHGDMGIK